MRKKTALLRQRKGAASALIILLLVLLIFFGVLALVAGAADLRLAKRRAEWNTAYYQADRQAQLLLALVDQTCANPEFSALNTADQARILADELAGQAQVSAESVQVVADEIIIAALVLSPDSPDQGIEITVTARPGTTQPMTINRWNWWREPFDYSDSFEGVWDGKSE